MLRNALAGRLCTGRTRMIQTVSQHWEGPRVRSSPVATHSTLQELYEVTRRNLAPDGQIASDGVQDVARALNAVSLRDLGLSAGLAEVASVSNRFSNVPLRQEQAKQRGRKIGYTEIHHGEDMTIAIFHLPPGTIIPLHDHPGMTVFSRLLYGTVHVRAYDFADGLDTLKAITPRPAQLITDRIISAPAEPCVLYPESGGNIHSFQAISPCAILDVLTPPYAPKQGRDCTYYRELFPAEYLDANGQPVFYNNGAAAGKMYTVELQEYQPAFETCSEPYRGVRVQPALSRSMR